MDPVEAGIKPGDIRVDTAWAGDVNVTITHMPTGTVTHGWHQRSQIRARELAMDALILSLRESKP